jgi:hypothetical protein
MDLSVLWGAPKTGGAMPATDPALPTLATWAPELGAASFLDALPGQTALLDQRGEILAVNQGIPELRDWATTPP